jgi:hypothetical protein
MHHRHVVAALPAFSPLDAETVIRAIAVGPEAEIKGRDEEDPIQGRACAGMGGLVGFRRAEMERVGVPCAGCVAVFD